MNPSQAASVQAPRREPLDNHTQNLAEAEEMTAFGKEQLAAIRQQIDESHGNWPERMAASVEEDYRQLLMDFGLR